MRRLEQKIIVSSAFRSLQASRALKLLGDKAHFMGSYSLQNPGGKFARETKLTTKILTGLRQFCFAMFKPG